jgi:hypothetical protein
MLKSTPFEGVRSSTLDKLICFVEVDAFACPCTFASGKANSAPAVRNRNAASTQFIRRWTAVRKNKSYLGLLRGQSAIDRRNRQAQE